MTTDKGSALANEVHHEQLAGPRALVFGCLAGIVFWAVVLFGALLFSVAMVGPGDDYMIWWWF